MQPNNEKKAAGSLFLRTRRFFEMMPDMKQRLEFGWAQTDITPTEPAPLAGQFHTRISKGVLDPLTATALAIRAEGSSEQAILASIDAVWVADVTRDRVRALLAKALPGFDPRKLVIGATHTHTAPSQLSRYFDYPVYGAPGILSQEDYTEFLAQRLAAVCAEAWAAKRPGAFAYGRAPAVVGHNRRAAYLSGESAMYGATDRDDFSHMEGYEDHFLDALFTYDADNALTGMILNVPCPSQVSENIELVSADYWHDVRRAIRARHGSSLFILPQCGAAGDQSPHIQVEQAAATRMQKLLGYDNAGAARRNEIADRIAAAVDTLVPALARDIRYSAEFAHRTLDLTLPRYPITEADVDRFSKIAADAETKIKSLEAAGADTLSHAYSSAYRAAGWYGRVEKNFKKQAARPDFTTETHILRLGDTAFATNRFELYLDYAMRMKCRSKAVQTFVVQLCGEGTYLPTERAMRGGSYGAIAPSIKAGPEGGRILVEETLRVLNALFDDTKQGT